ncbi:P1 family peptidase, partial [Streptomyces sp. URMC 123]|uniref:P1 family peptidase n=1 Tax=Streptomyces sp. URMC 123 TaxID=3423403 RepID=UPI003F1E12E4
GVKGGTGTASVVLPTGTTVAALVVVNASGSVHDPVTGALYGQWFTATGREGLALPSPSRHAEAQRLLAAARAESALRSAASVRPPLNTTLAVVATDATLTRAQAQKLAGAAHDGLARAVRPVHQLSDGDTVFALATGDRPLVATGGGGKPAPYAVHATAGALNEVFAAGADVLTRAVVKAVLAAESVDGPGGVFPCYAELYPDQVPAL